MNAETVPDKRVFVLMPFRDEFDDVYMVVQDAVRLASQALHITIECLRADEIPHPGRISEQILHAIRNADLLVADLSGSNPNVMYELGFGHALEKPSVIINQEVLSSPFDVQDFRQILYDRSKLVKECRPSLVATFRDVFAFPPEAMALPQDADDTSVAVGDPEQSADLPAAPMRIGPELLAAIQRQHLGLTYAGKLGDKTRQKILAKELLDLLGRITVVGGSNFDRIDNTAAATGNCAVELEKAEFFDEAESVYRRALGLFPHYAGLHLQYCDYLADAGRIEEARRELERAKELELDSDDITRIEREELKLALSARDGKTDPSVGERLREQFVRNPGDRETAASYLLYASSADIGSDQFESICNKWKEAAPEQEKWMCDRALADYFAQQNAPELICRAAELYDSLLSQGMPDNETRADTLHNVAQVYLRLQKIDLAKARFVEAYSLKPADPTIRTVFSQALFMWGDLESAVAVIEGNPLPIES